MGGGGGGGDPSLFDDFAFICAGASLVSGYIVRNAACVLYNRAAIIAATKTSADSFRRPMA